MGVKAPVLFWTPAILFHKNITNGMNNIILIILTFQASTPTSIYISKLHTKYFNALKGTQATVKISGYFHQVLKFGPLELANVSFSDCYIRVILPKDHKNKDRKKS